MWDLYLEKIKNISSRRKLQKIAYEITLKAEEEEDLLSFKKNIINEISSIDTGIYRKMSEPSKNAVDKFMDLMDKKEYGNISTGFSDLDREIQGFYPGSFYIIGGIPTVGKTTFILNLLNNVCRKGKKVLFASLEMP